MTGRQAESLRWAAVNRRKQLGKVFWTECRGRCVSLPSHGLTTAYMPSRSVTLHIPRCIRDATGLERKQVKKLLEEIGALRTALESHNSR